MPAQEPAFVRSYDHWSPAKPFGRRKSFLVAGGRRVEPPAGYRGRGGPGGVGATARQATLRTIVFSESEMDFIMLVRRFVIVDHVFMSICISNMRSVSDRFSLA